MSRPIVTIALSDDGNSVFVYSGGYEPATDNSAHAYDVDTRDLAACLGLQNEDFARHLANHVRDIVAHAVST